MNKKSPNPTKQIPYKGRAKNEMELGVMVSNRVSRDPEFLQQVQLAQLSLDNGERADKGKPEPKIGRSTPKKR